MNSRRFIAAPEAQPGASYWFKQARWKGITVNASTMSALGQKQTFRLVLGPLYPRKRILGGDERSCFELKTDIVGWLGVVSSA